LIQLYILEDTQRAGHKCKTDTTSVGIAENNKCQSNC